MENKLSPIIATYNIDEEYLYSKTYCFIKGFAIGRGYNNTLRALPLARNLHNNQYRKGYVEKYGKKVRLPYVSHVLKVCATLISLNLPLSHDELDILYTSALLHDVLEDASEEFPNGGMELVHNYKFPKEVLEIVLLLSKESGLKEKGLNKYFNKLKLNKIALIIKLADRGHNVEDLYNMKNVPKYIEETKTYILNGLCSYGKANYPEFSEGITILKSKILSLTETVEVMYEKQIEEISKKDEEIEKLKKIISGKNTEKIFDENPEEETEEVLKEEKEEKKQANKKEEYDVDGWFEQEYGDEW